MVLIVVIYSKIDLVIPRNVLVIWSIRGNCTVGYLEKLQQIGDGIAFFKEVYLFQTFLEFLSWYFNRLSQHVEVGRVWFNITVVTLMKVRNLLYYLSFETKHQIPYSLLLTLERSSWWCDWRVEKQILWNNLF